MRYMGSKGRHAKEIVPILMDGHDLDAWYFEPFLGGGNIFSEVPAKFKHGSDIAKYAVALLEALSKGWKPPESVSEEEYKAVKRNSEAYEDAYVGFVAYCCSYSGKFWGGYWRAKDNKGNVRNCALEQSRNLERQRNGLVGAHFSVSSYCDLLTPSGSTIYCDPPYANTTGYKGEFNHDYFWDWCRVQALQNSCRVFVSEYQAPEDFECVWEKSVTNSLTKDTGSKRGTEKLFRLTNP